LKLRSVADVVAHQAPAFSCLIGLLDPPFPNEYRVQRSKRQSDAVKPQDDAPDYLQDLSFGLVTVADVRTPRH
jgi:hypothetical protein